MPFPNQGDKPQRPVTILLLALVALAVIVLSHVPVLKYVFMPLEYFTTTLHEVGHAGACLATGGSVAGLTIVGDGNGHAGLTFCSGGVPFIVAQAGYLATAVFGCLLLLLGSARRNARGALYLLAGIVALSVVLFMSVTLFMPGHFVQAVLSMVVGTIGALAMFLTARKAPEGLVHALVVFLAVNTVLSAFGDIAFVTMLSAGIVSGGSSDAGSMATLTGIPAVFWGALWAVTSLALLVLTVKRINSRRG
jgi:hypothetical protein